MSALRSRTPLMAFAPVFVLGAALGAVLFFTPEKQPEPREQAISQVIVEGNDETVQRVMVKNSIVEDLLQGVLTWDEALERFIAMIYGNEDAAHNLDCFDAKGSMRMRVAKQLLMFAKIRAHEQPAKFGHSWTAILDTARSDVGEYEPSYPK